jgi:hypothetical protein
MTAISIELFRPLSSELVDDMSVALRLVANLVSG